jgi:hypothetical protein
MPVSPTWQACQFMRIDSLNRLKVALGLAGLACQVAPLEWTGVSEQGIKRCWFQKLQRLLVCRRTIPVLWMGRSPASCIGWNRGG